jgi:uncharacterized repeat protein (TIGR01451 family)
MFFGQPYKTLKAARKGKQKLASLLLTSALLWLPINNSQAAILNTVTATGMQSGVQVKGTATASVDVENANPIITVSEIATLHDGGDGSADIGDTITYTFTITNAGNITLNTITLNDVGVTLVGGPIATLAPGAVDTLTFTATHVLTEAEIATAGHANPVTVNAIAASGGPVSASTTVNTPLSVISSMIMEKTGVLSLGTNARADVGDDMLYSFKVTNTGPTKLHNVKITDPLVNVANLPGQERMVAMLTASEQPSDPLTTASISTSAETSAAANSYVENLVPHQTVPSLPAALGAQRKIVRMSGTTENIAAGDKIGFVYALTNMGEGPLTTIMVHQADAKAYGNTLDILAPNSSDSANFIFTRQITEAEIKAGEIQSPAAITAKNRDSYFATAIRNKVLVADIARFDDFASASITPTAVNDLPAGAETTFSTHYALTQLDIDRGFVDNTATATAINATSQTLSSMSSFHQPLVAAPGIAVIKTGAVNLGADNMATVGDVVTYHFTITNTGNVTMNNVKITDTNAVVPNTIITNLAPGATNATITATHALTQIDIDAGQVSNQASVEGTPPIGSKITELSDDDKLIEKDPTLVKLVGVPKIGLLKTVFAVTDVNLNGMTDKNDTITYHFSVTNMGNQTLKNILVTDPLVAVGDKNGNVPAQSLAQLDPGQTNNDYFSSVYTITQDDVDNGEVDNTAKVEGTAPGNVQVIDYSDPGVLTQDGPTKQIIEAKPIITLVKAERDVDPIVDTNNNGVIDADDVIHYTFRVENAGNVTLTDVNVTELLAGATVQGAVVQSLAPNTFDDQTFTATYTITADDVRAGRVSNQARATAKSKISRVSVSDLSDNSNPAQNNPTISAIKPDPAIALKKTIASIEDFNHNGFTDEGDKIHYAFSILNTGNVPLLSVSVTDAPLNVVGLPLAQLNAGVENTSNFTAVYVLTAADLAAGKFSNSASVQGTTANLTLVTDVSDDNSYKEDDPTVVYFAAKPSVALLKTVASTDDNDNSLTFNTGDTIHYRFTVINNGNEKLTNITLEDANANVTGGPLNELLPNATDSTTFTGTHVVTLAEFLAGQVINQATVHAHANSLTTELKDKSDSSNVNGDEPTVTPLSTVPGIALIKTVKKVEDFNGDGITDPDDIITYAFDVVNTGNVDITDVVLTDATATLLPNPATLASLPRGTHNATAFTATHVITIDDAIVGEVINSASVIGKTPAGAVGNVIAFGASPSNADTVSDVSDYSVLTDDRPTVTPVFVPPAVLTKTANKTEVKRGESVTYTITGANLIGASYVITDIMPPDFSFVSGSASVNGVSVPAVADGRNINFLNVAPIAGKITIKVKLLASTTLAGGKFVNNARLIKPSTGEVLATAQATVAIAIEAVFDCSDVIGHVFDDVNANGYMDNGEPGLPGVRVVTLNGVLITTDSEGRYHVPCAAIPDAKIGSNYLLKLDTRTLPTGYNLTTENPRDVRVTKGKISKLNFGATIAHVVKLDLSPKAFEDGSSDLKEKWIAGVDKLIATLAQKHASLKIVYHPQNESQSVITERLAAMVDTITFAWENSNPSYELSVTTAVEDGK